MSKNKIIAMRKGSKVQGYLSQRNEIWRYTLDDLPQTEPINSSIANLTDAFFAIDETSLVCEGTSRLENVCTHAFCARARNWAHHGLPSTRKGFSIRFQTKSLAVSIKLNIDCEAGLLLKMVGKDETGVEVFQTSYFIKEVSVSLDEAIFVMKESSADYKTIHIADALLSSINPDEAELPPFQN